MKFSATTMFHRRYSTDRHPRAIAPGFLPILIGVISVVGCLPSGEPPPSVPNPNPRPPVHRPLRLLVVDDPELANVIPREWRAHYEDELDVQQTTSLQLLSRDNEGLPADAIIYPSRLLGELAERRAITRLPRSLLDDDRWDRRDIFELIRWQEITWGGQAYAVPLGSPQFVVYYRRDVFAHLGIEPPQTWSEFQRLAMLLSQREELGQFKLPGDAPWFGAVQPLAPGWASQVLLARAAPYARHRGYYSTLFEYRTMKPLVDGAPFVRALEQLVASARFGPPDASQLTPHDARRLMLRGHCGMALAWPSSAATEEINADNYDTDIGYAELPGASEVFDLGEQRWEQRDQEESMRVPMLGVAGRLGSLVNRTRHKRAAINLLGWLSGKESSQPIASRSQFTTLFRLSHIDSPNRWVDDGVALEAARGYVRLVAETQSRSAWLMSLRIPRQGRYLEALDRAILRALSGEETPETALQAVATTWRTITEELGQESQQLAYARSLGLESSLP